MLSRYIYTDYLRKMLNTYYTDLINDLFSLQNPSLAIELNNLHQSRTIIPGIFMT